MQVHKYVGRRKIKSEGNTMANDIQKRVTDFHNRLIADKNHRYKSWEHCYSHFITKEAGSNINLSCLHLAFYLASWGMYRGSSFLLWKDYQIHREVVKHLIQNKELQQLDFSTNGDAELKRIIELSKWIKGWYRNKIKTVNGEPKTVNVTDTLATKIILGTLGCVPAYDQYFIDGMRKSGVSCSRLDLSSLKRIVGYYHKYQDQFNEVQKTIKKNSDIHYPIMKLVDMYFWGIGFEERKR
jgi:hypothetical protein